MYTLPPIGQLQRTLCMPCSITVNKKQFLSNPWPVQRIREESSTLPATPQQLLLSRMSVSLPCYICCRCSSWSCTQRIRIENSASRRLKTNHILYRRPLALPSRKSWHIDCDENHKSPRSFAIAVRPGGCAKALIAFKSIRWKKKYLILICL